jgi:hypothetical protein
MAGTAPDALSRYQQVGLPHLGGVDKGVVHVNKCVGARGRFMRAPAAARAARATYPIPFSLRLPRAAPGTCSSCGGAT